tara:strand:- start:800 stop:3487 length:2688 start_codon:yes stop_codon:yes gene_type:complete
MDYNLNIVTSVKGQSQIDSALKTIAKVRSLAADIKPISLTTRRGGKLHDEIRKARTELDKFSQRITNALKRGESTASEFSSTLAGVNGQARAFATALDNISLKSGKSFDEQTAQVKNYANALAEAEKKAENLAFTQNQVVRTARQRAGVAIGPATQLGSPEALAQQVRFESAQIEKGNRLRKQQVALVERINALASKDVQVGQLNSQVARINLALDEKRVDAAEEMSEELRDQIRQNEKIINQNKTKKKGAEDEEKAAKKTRRTRKQMLGDAAQGAILGGGFPLLFGGPSFSAAGGLIGGGVGGAAFGQKASFAGGIAGSVLLTPLDAAVDAAVELGKALEDPTRNAQQLIDLLPLSGTKTKGLIRQLQDLGLNSTASAVAVETLSEEIGDFGIEDIEKFKEKNDEFANEVKKLRLSLAALASNKLIGFITFLTQAVNLFNRAGGPDPGGGMLGRAAGFAQAQGEMADEGALGGTGAPPAKPDKPPLPTQKQIDIAKRVKAIRQSEIMLAGLEVKIEQDRFSLIRGQFEVEQSKIALGQANIKLAKADLELANAQTDADEERLGLKQALAEAAFLEAKAAKENAEISARQQQASAELGIRQFLQGIQLNEMQQRIEADRQVRSTSPFARESFLMDPFFGKSSELQNEQALRYTETLDLLNKQINENNLNIKMGQDLSDAEKEALVRKGILLERELKLQKELTPARNEAALAQVRFAEAMALTVPVTDSLFDSLVSVVDGTKTAEQAFADFLRSIASMLADAAKQIIATYIAIGIARMFAGMPKMSSGETIDITAVDPNIVNSLGGLTPRANGGPVGAGQPYMVGERGPELFVPGAQGNIVPNNAMGSSNIVVNVDASGSSVQGDSDQATQLGNMLAAAVQSELVKQKRPGGLLAS